MNDIQLRLECMRMASQIVGDDQVFDLAKRMFDWISQGAWGECPVAKPAEKIAA